MGITYLVDTASIAMTAKNHFPLLLESSNLITNGIIPGDWEIEESKVSIEESHVYYKNGILLEMDYLKFQISESCEESFQDSYLIHKIADRFLEKTPYIPYQSLGLNYIVAFEQDKPRQWLLERFVPSYLRSKENIDVFAMLPRMFFDMGGELRSICKLEINAGSVNREGVEKELVVITINMDHGGSLNGDKMREAINLWQEKQDFVISKLDMIFGEIE